jgi:hypothetical protein
VSPFNHFTPPLYEANVTFRTRSLGRFIALHTSPLPVQEKINVGTARRGLRVEDLNLHLLSTLTCKHNRA